MLFLRKKPLSVIFTILVCMGFALSFYNSRAETESQTEYLSKLEGPYRKFYTKLSGFTERPSPAEMYAIYEEFDKELHSLKIPAGLVEKKGEAYKQFLDLPEIYRQDYKDSAYKYSTIIGQANNAKIMLDFIEKQK